MRSYSSGCISVRQWLMGLGLVLFASAIPAGGADSAPPQAGRRDATAAGLGKELTVDLGGGVSMAFVPIPAGSFTMGSDQGVGGNDKPAHKVTIGKSFYMAKTETTQKQWETVMGNNPSFTKGPDNPVDKTGWEDCRQYVAKLNETVGGGRRFRLPTDAEWEYACRAGTSTTFCFGDDEALLSEYCWFVGNSANRSHPVAQKKPNAWGLYDMHGNVWEWCADGKRDYSEGAETADPIGPDAPLRVIRGGAYSTLARYCRSAERNVSRTDLAWYTGFRLVLELQAPGDTPPSSSVAEAVNGKAASAGRIRGAVADGQLGWFWALFTADTYLLTKHVPDDFAAAKATAEEAQSQLAVGDTAAAVASFKVATASLWRAYDVARTAENASKTTPVIERLQAALAAANKPDAEEALDELEKLAPCDKKLADLRKRVAAIPGRGKWLTIDLGGGVSMQFVPIRAGSFTMGGAGKESAHRVTIGKPFCMSRTEVTQKQWEAVMGNNPSSFKGPDHPIEGVGDQAVQAFIEKLSEKAGGGRAFRLPTDAQWEYACRAGSTTKFCYGDDEAAFDEYGWFLGNAENRTQPVAQKKPNAWGLYDMHGNVWEWTCDGLRQYAAGEEATDPIGPSDGAVRRGGAWFHVASWAESANRQGGSGKWARGGGFDQGIRVVTDALE